LHRQHLPPGAFTLIELLAASLLAAMLMAVIVGLVRTTHAQSRAAQRALAANPATSILTDQIRRDFVNARYWAVLPDQVRLSGYIAHDLRTRRQTFRRAEVTYAVVSNRQGSWLVREETQIDEVIGRRSQRDVVWHGVAGLDVAALDNSQFEPAAGAAPPGMTPVPSHLTVEIRGQSGKTVMYEDIVHHDMFP